MHVDREISTMPDQSSGVREITLVSHHLCPYVQRAAIALAEKSVPFRRFDIDLSNKPDWFLALSPLGKVPLLAISEAGRRQVIFESAVIIEYLEETSARPLHPADALERARHRSWIEFASQVLNRIAGFYSAKEAAELEAERRNLSEMFRRLEGEVGDGPWFGGDAFSLVDAAFAPVFRYFDVFETYGESGFFDGLTQIQKWRASLERRESVRGAVAQDYEERLFTFLLRRHSALSRKLMAYTSGATA
jgi:glutathione S-transferase